MSIGNKPASEMTYREWLVGKALTAVAVDQEMTSGCVAVWCLELADACVMKLDYEAEVAWKRLSGCAAAPKREEHPNRIPLDFTAVKTDGVTDASGDDLPPGGGFVPTKADR